MVARKRWYVGRVGPAAEVSADAAPDRLGVRLSTQFGDDVHERPAAMGTQVPRRDADGHRFTDVQRRASHDPVAHVHHAQRCQREVELGHEPQRGREGEHGGKVIGTAAASSAAGNPHTWRYRRTVAVSPRTVASSTVSGNRPELALSRLGSAAASSTRE